VADEALDEADEEMLIPFKNNRSIRVNDATTVKR